jgi:hypothetical protein
MTDDSMIVVDINYVARLRQAQEDLATLVGILRRFRKGSYAFFVDADGVELEDAENPDDWQVETMELRGWCHIGQSEYDTLRRLLKGEQ